MDNAKQQEKIADLAVKVADGDPRTLGLLASVLAEVSADEQVLYLTILWRMNCTGSKLYYLWAEYTGQELIEFLSTLIDIRARDEFVTVASQQLEASQQPMESRYQGWENDLRALSALDTTLLIEIPQSSWAQVHKFVSQELCLVQMLLLHHMGIRGQMVPAALDEAGGALNLILLTTSPTHVAERAEWIARLSAKYPDSDLGIYPGWTLIREQLWRQVAALNLPNLAQEQQTVPV